VLHARGILVPNGTHGCCGGFSFLDMFWLVTRARKKPRGFVDGVLLQKQSAASWDSTCLNLDRNENVQQKL
jgi:hypothetical protein